MFELSPAAKAVLGFLVFLVGAYMLAPDSAKRAIARLFGRKTSKTTGASSSAATSASAR